jgi:hypothetical protein
MIILFGSKHPNYRHSNIANPIIAGAGARGAVSGRNSGAKRAAQEVSQPEEGRAKVSQ